MMKKILYILMIAFALASCVKTERDLPVPVVLEEDDDDGETRTVVIGFSVSLPEREPGTKALADTPENDLKTLHVAVFGSSGYLKEYVKAESVELPVNNNTQYAYVVKLTLSENSKRRIHIIGNGPELLPFDQETTIIPTLLSEAGQGAYWQSFVLPGIRAKRDENGNMIGAQTVTVAGETVYTGTGSFEVSDETKAYFDPVALVRNFAKIEVLDNIPGNNFSLISFAAVNIPTNGSIAPYYENGFVYEYQKKSYTGLKDTLNYPALLPREVSFDTTIPSKNAFVTCDTDSVATAAEGHKSFFIYERPIPNDYQEPTIVIVYGHYTDPDLSDGEDESGDYFYKVDLMENREYYPLYRNFKYQIRIEKISKPGADTPEEAALSMGSGDVSADIATQKLTDISDGQSRILVEYMAKTIIRKYPYEDNGQTTDLVLQYKFFPDVTVMNQAGTEPVANNDLVANGGPMSISLGNGTMITGYTVDAADDPNTGWRAIRITTTDPTSQVRTQTLTVTGTVQDNENGVLVDRALYRTVTFTMLSKQTMTVECTPSRIQKFSGEDVDVVITIPNHLPESMFPLIFNLESDNMTLTPDNSHSGNNLPVVSGTSIIPNNDKTTFHFVRTLSYSEYESLPKDAVGNNVYFTCYFLTNKAENASKVYVANDYFETDYAEFSNYTMKHFTDLSFTDAGTNSHSVSMASGALTYLSFNIETLAEEGDALPERVYITLDGLRPTGQSGLMQVGQTNQYWYSPTQTTNPQLLNNANPVLNLATSRAGGIVNATISAEEYIDATIHAEPKSYTYQWLTQARTTNINNYKATSADLGKNKNVYLYFEYDEGKVEPITFTLNGLNYSSVYNSAGTWTNNGNGTYTFTPNNTNTRTYCLTLTTTTNFSAVSVTMSGASYMTTNATLARGTQFTIPANALNLDGGSWANNTYTTLYSDRACSNSIGGNGSRRQNNRNRDAITVDISSFANPNDNTPVYFSEDRGLLYSTYYATSTLGALIEAQNTTNGRVTITFTTTAP